MRECEVRWSSEFMHLLNSPFTVLHIVRVVPDAAILSDMQWRRLNERAERALPSELCLHDPNAQCPRAVPNALYLKSR